jgi:hypothetical protein
MFYDYPNKNANFIISNIVPFRESQIDKVALKLLK